VQDFCFAKEVKLGTYSDKGTAPPGALIATKRMMKDPRTEPQYGERVPYVVVAGAPGARLWERCVEPERLIHDEYAELDAEYYISKNLIPPLERIFNLVGANVRQWYDEMPKVQRIRLLGGSKEGESKNKTMESYMGSSLCLACRAKLPPVPAGVEEPQLPLCSDCKDDQPQKTMLTLRGKVEKAERRARDLSRVCRSCANLAWDEQVKCDSRDCAVFYSRVKANTQLSVVRNGLGRVLEAFQAEEAQNTDLEW
jgi:DNA polymerase zeta